MYILCVYGPSAWNKTDDDDDDDDVRNTAEFVNTAVDWVSMTGWH